MTLNLTLLHPRYVLQVSDRRITKKPSGEIHPLANKNVVYLARDGLVSICYSGPAYMEHVPTDTWIACKLAGEDIAPYRDGRSLRDGGRGILMRGGDKKPWLDIGQSVELLKRECEAVKPVTNLDILLAGWQKYNRGMRPICWGIEGRGSAATAENPFPRYWHYEKSPYGKPRYCLTEIPGSPGWLSIPEMRRLVAFLRVEAMSPDASLRRLVWAVRYVAAKSAGVGPDCMCILLPNPDVQPELFVRYEPVTEERAVITGGERDVEVPAAFAPWFVGPRIHAPPAIIIGGGPSPFTLGDIRPILQAPPVPQQASGPRIVFAFSSQRRPEDPSLGPGTR